LFVNAKTTFRAEFLNTVLIFIITYSRLESIIISEIIFFSKGSEVF